ncbi:hypothetical protein NQ318_000947 [Aromia moschata]|uniref:Uncharacterized protein n=1 Tax=Aromia moschata TaxID=1265417 RepID=A0AAV8ZDM1_9CUCU|nr:hypothetical protein NQ318_000947 [Aromia moschata]
MSGCQFVLKILLVPEGKPNKDVKSALNQETNVMGYHELEECLDIKSEGEVKKEEDECDWDHILK